MQYALFFAIKREFTHANRGYLPFGSRLTYARLGVSLYAGYSHMRVAAVVICLWSRYRGRKPFYAVEWGNDRLCREMADTVIMAGQGQTVPGAVRSGGGGLCPGSRDNLRAGRGFFLHSVPDLYQTMKCDG